MRVRVIIHGEVLKAITRGDRGTVSMFDAHSAAFGGTDPSRGGKLHAEKRPDRTGRAVTRWVSPDRRPRDRTPTDGLEGSVADGQQILQAGLFDATPQIAPSAEPDSAPAAASMEPAAEHPRTDASLNAPGGVMASAAARDQDVEEKAQFFRGYRVDNYQRAVDQATAAHAANIAALRQLTSEILHAGERHRQAQLAPGSSFDAGRREHEMLVRLHGRRDDLIRETRDNHAWLRFLSERRRPAKPRPFGRVRITGLDEALKAIKPPRPGLVPVKRQDKRGKLRWVVRWMLPASVKPQDTVHHGHSPKLEAAVTHGELVAAAERFTGGGEYHATARDEHGRPLFVPRQDPHEAWDRVRAKVAERIGTIETDAAAEQRSEQWTNGTAGTVEDLHAMAVAAEPAWVDCLKAIARSVPGAAAYFGKGGQHAVKSAKSLADKVASKARKIRKRGFTDEEASSLAVNQDAGDALRGTILVDTPEQIGPVVAAVKAEMKRRGIDVTFDNKWEKAGTESGYVGVHAAVYFPTPHGLVQAELQFHPRALVAPKETEHGIYETTRRDGFDGDKVAYNRASKLMWLAALLRIHKENGV